MAASRSRRGDEGFTLIELITVVAILPLVIGAVAVGLLSVIQVQGNVSSSLTDSSDAQVVSASFQNDVQSAADITTDATSTNPAPCGTAFQVLGLELADGTEISYEVTQQASQGKTPNYILFKNTCANGSTTPTNSNAVAHDMPSSVLSTSTPPVTVGCSSSSSACSGTPPAYASNWEPTTGLTGVTFSVTAPGSSYKYTLTAVPAASSSSASLQAVSSPSSGCGFAISGTGTYASTLCFLDFTGWNTQTSATGKDLPTCTSGGIPLSNSVTNTPYVISFCMTVTGYSAYNTKWTTASTLNGSCGSSGSQLSGVTDQSGGTGTQTRDGYNDIAGVPLPTYADPPTSEAFLGNNGFYTGISNGTGTSVAPGLYTVDEGSCATIKLYNITLQTSAGVAATNWALVTGDAESTDGAESLIWSSDQDLSLLPNSTNSPVGNACQSNPALSPGYNTTYLTGLSTPSTTVQCSSTISEDHTGTVMLEAKTPTTLTDQLFGTGLQAVFVAVLLP